MKKWLPVIFAGIAMILFLAIDRTILTLIESIRFSALDSFFSALLLIQTEPYLEIWIIVIMFFIIIKNKDKLFPRFIISFIIVSVITLILKNVVGRVRPLGQDLKSFPSGHATVIFSTFPFLKNKIVRIVWFTFAILLVFTRVYFQIHYPSDVMAGFIIGYGIGLIVEKWNIKF
ncbi:MAG: phosphatase PAP2 family protein [archaeon]|nr:MAG: phosphatase PAP2 family protein [archaeon]